MCFGCEIKFSHAAFCLPSALLFNEIGLAYLYYSNTNVYFSTPNDAVRKNYPNFLGASSLVFSRLSGKHTSGVALPVCPQRIAPLIQPPICLLPVFWPDYKQPPSPPPSPTLTFPFLERCKEKTRDGPVPQSKELSRGPPELVQHFRL
jgi:hypothetical protein